MTDPVPNQQQDKEPTLAQTAASAAAAMFGVQSSKNRDRDFKSKSPAKFILMGAAMTCVFILVVLLAVRFAMQTTGATP